MQTINEYAEAIFTLGCEINQVDDFSKQFKQIKAILKENPEYLNLLSSPHIPISERNAAVDAAFGNDFHEYIVSFIHILCEKRHIEKLPLIIKDFEALRKNLYNTATAKVTTAVELTDDEKKRLKATLEEKCGKKVTLKCRVDEKLLGGIVIKVDGKIIDGSLKSRLTDIKEVISK